MADKKKIVIAVAILAVAGALFLPLSNSLGMNGEKTPIEVRTDDVRFRQVSHILQAKCMDCHTPSMSRFPIYTQFPIARQIIDDDIAAASRSILIKPEHYSGEESFTPGMLAQIEWVVASHSMPPLRYKLMHWDAGLTDEDAEAVLSWIRSERAESPLARPMADDLKGEPVQPLPQTVDLDRRKVALGGRLFHDNRLSGDNTLSCASCHALNKGGTDQLPVSVGIRGQKGPINAPTVFNAMYNIAQFWDGRAKDLVEQAGGPVTNPIEMGAEWDDVIAKLKQDPGYVRDFGALYPKQGIVPATVQDAIATFEESLVTPDSRFDRYLRGETGVLTANEIHGYELFKSMGCASCHYGPALGGGSFEKMGVQSDYFRDRGGDLHEVDYGRFNVTQAEADRHHFKVPTLRNAALTWPYFHDASAETLEDAVRVMAKYQLGRNLTDTETDHLVQFLHTLTGTYEGVPLAPTETTVADEQ